MKTLHRCRQYLADHLMTSIILAIIAAIVTVTVAVITTLQKAPAP